MDEQLPNQPIPTGQISRERPVNRLHPAEAFAELPNGSKLYRCTVCSGVYLDPKRAVACSSGHQARASLLDEATRRIEGLELHSLDAYYLNEISKRQAITEIGGTLSQLLRAIKKLAEAQTNP